MPRSAGLDGPGVFHRMMIRGWTAERYLPSYLLSPAGKYVSSASVKTVHALLFQEFQQIIQHVHLDDMAGIRPVERNWGGPSCAQIGFSNRLFCQTSFERIPRAQVPSGPLR